MRAPVRRATNNDFHTAGVGQIGKDPQYNGAFFPVFFFLGVTSVYHRLLLLSPTRD